jgi:hypothetical protein
MTWATEWKEVIYPPRYFRLPPCHPVVVLNHHAAIMAHPGNNKKPTVGFGARFLLEGLERRLSLEGNGLQLRESHKMEKTQKKVQNNFGGTPVFLQNGPFFRPKTALE